MLAIKRPMENIPDLSANKPVPSRPPNTNELLPPVVFEIAYPEDWCVKDFFLCSACSEFELEFGHSEFLLHGNYLGQTNTTFLWQTIDIFSLEQPSGLL